MNNTIEILDLFEFKKEITNEYVDGIKPDTYYVNSHGGIFMKTPKNHDNKSSATTEYEFKPIGTNKPGMIPKITLRMEDNSRKTFGTHKLMAAMYLQPAPTQETMSVKFKDGNVNNLMLLIWNGFLETNSLRMQEIVLNREKNLVLLHLRMMKSILYVK